MPMVAASHSAAFCSKSGVPGVNHGAAGAMSGTAVQPTTNATIATMGA